MLSTLWQIIRRHPFATAFVGFAGIAPLHAGFVAHMYKNPVVAKLYMTALWCCGIPIALGLAAMLANTIWPLVALPAKGICPTCGFDLRATPDRCPECGTIVQQEREDR